MKKWIHASYQFEYELEVISEANDENDNPTCWGMKFLSNDGDTHYVWITKYDDSEYIIEDADGNNLTKKKKVYKTFSGAKRGAAEIARLQVMKDRFTN